jgi:hypothetical protein
VEGEDERFPLKQPKWLRSGAKKQSVGMGKGSGERIQAEEGQNKIVGLE